MRRVGLTDLDLAARAVLSVPPEARLVEVSAMLEAAHTADKLRKRLGRAFPGFGDGSLASEALRRDPAQSPRNGPEYIEALRDVTEALVARRRGYGAYPCTQDRQRGNAGSRPSRAGSRVSPQSVQ